MNNLKTNLIPGERLEIIAKLDYSESELDIDSLLDLGIKQLEQLYKESADTEYVIFEKIKQLGEDWKLQAEETRKIMRVLSYKKTLPPKHTYNGLDMFENGWCEISNKVYKMRYRIDEEEKYNQETDEYDIVAWRLTWEVGTNAEILNRKFAGQSKKRFTDKDVLNKYLAGRIKAYSHLFKEISPPIPSLYANYFKLYGKLLPGYTLANDE